MLFIGAKRKIILETGGSFPTARSRGARPNSGFFILSFCQSVKESIKESAFERRQKLPAGTGAAPLCQHLKSGADYRDATTSLKMKHSRRLWGERRTFLAVAVAFRRIRRREEGLWRALSMPPHRKTFAQLHNARWRGAGYPPKKFFHNVIRCTKAFFLYFYLRSK